VARRVGETYASTGRRASTFAPLLLLFAVVTAPGVAHAQVVTGVLRDSGTKQPILLGTVALLDTTLAVVDQVFTNEKGSFVLNAPKAGAYYVLADRLGYKRSVDGILELGAGGSINVDFFLRPEPLVLDSIVVAARRERAVRHLNNVGFYERREQGFGHFITPEQIEKRAAFEPADLLRTIPGVRTQKGPLGTQVLFSRGPRDCPPAIYLDAARIPDSASIEQVVAVEDVAAIELYTRATTVPLEWGGTGAGCGVMLIWTRK
jgi:hypothetical protein